MYPSCGGAAVAAHGPTVIFESTFTLAPWQAWMAQVPEPLKKAPATTCQASCLVLPRWWTPSILYCLTFLESRVVGSSTTNATQF